MKMKLDLSKFKMLKKDDKVATLRHPDGHEFRIAINALHPMNRKNLDSMEMHVESDKSEAPKKGAKAPIKKMADGGEVADDQQQAPEAAAPEQQPLSVESIEPDAQMTPAADSSLPTSSQPQMMPPTQQPTASLASAPSATLASSQAPAGQAVPEPTIEQGYQSQIEGAKGRAAAESQMGQQQALAQKQAVDQQQKLISNFQTQSKGITDEIGHVIADIKSNHIDPNRYMASRNTGQKIMIGLGVLLGGMGAGVTGGSNPAMDYVNQQIDRDIDAQKANAGKQMNLVSLYEKQYGNLRDATDMARLTMQSITLNKMKQAEAEAQTPMAKANMQATIGALQSQMAPTFMQMSMRRALMSDQQHSGQLHQQDPATVVPLLVPKEHQAKAFSEIEAAQDTKRMAGSILKSFDDAAKDNTVLKTGAGVLRTPASVYALHQSMQPTFKDLEGTVRQAAMDNTFKNITPAPGDADATIATKRRALMDYLKSKASAPTAKGYGIDLNQFESTAPTAGPAEIKTVGGVQYQKVPGGWKRVQ